MTNTLIILSGCSGGGKSTLLSELAKRGHPVVPEAGRRVVAQALETGTDALPWRSPEQFVRACVDLHLKDLRTLEQNTNPSFVDRSLFDVISFLDLKDLPIPEDLAQHLAAPPNYAKRVFFAPPWREIFTNDRERRASFEEAKRACAHLRNVYETYGFDMCELPRTSVERRADWIEKTLIGST